MTYQNSCRTVSEKLRNANIKWLLLILIEICEVAILCEKLNSTVNIAI